MHASRLASACARKCAFILSCRNGSTCARSHPSPPPQPPPASPAPQLLNHITGRVNVRLHHDAERGALQMIATRPISAGEEVVNNYGCLSNADLLRGYGYVEERNENEHAQVPGQFLVRAAAGAKQRAAADAKGAGAGGAGAGGKEGVDKEAGEEEEEGSSDDGEVYESDDDEGESSDDSEESSEPDYELEDDYAPPGGGGGSEDEGGGSEDGGEGGEEEGGEALTAARAAAKAAGSPLLVDAAEVIPDWEDRWALAHALRLLPKGGVFGVFSGGAPPREMVAVTALLLAGVPQCKRLLAAAQKAGRGGGEEAGGGGGGASVAAELQVRRGAARSRPEWMCRRGSVYEDRSLGRAHLLGAPLGTKALPCMSSPPTQTRPAPTRPRAALPQLPPAGQLQDALRAAARLMLLRYTCGLEADEKLLADAGKLPPRLHAAVRARAGEKRCLHAMLQVRTGLGGSELRGWRRAAVWWQGVVAWLPAARTRIWCVQTRAHANTRARHTHETRLTPAPPICLSGWRTRLGTLRWTRWRGARLRTAWTRWRSGGGPQRRLSAAAARRRARAKTRRSRVSRRRGPRGRASARGGRTRAEAARAVRAVARTVRRAAARRATSSASSAAATARSGKRRSRGRRRLTKASTLGSSYESWHSVVSCAACNSHAAIQRCGQQVGLRVWQNLP